MKKIGTILTALIMSVSLTLPIGTYAMESDDIDFAAEFDMDDDSFDEDFIDDTEIIEDDLIETEESESDLEEEFEEDLVEEDDLKFDEEEFEIMDTFDATYAELNQLAVFLNQETNYTCTLCSATMMLRRAALLDGKDWRSITESAVRQVAWPGGLSWSFSYAGYAVYGGTYIGDKSSSERWTILYNLLKAHPEGIVAYNGEDEHAVLLTDYTNGMWYCADPATAATEGRIPLYKAYKINGPSDITRVWYITSPGVTPPTNVELPQPPPVTPIIPDPEPEPLPPVDEAKVTEFVTRLYKNVLTRRPDETGLKYWVKKMTTREMNGLEVADSFVNSPELTKRNLTDSDYIDMLYNAFMGRNPESNGKKHWTNILSIGMTRYYVFASFANSAEFGAICADYGIEQGKAEPTEPRDQNEGITGFVSRLYTKCLGRSYDVTGLNDWCKKILCADDQKTKAIQVAREFFESNEFKGNLMNQDDAVYIQILYRTFLNRESDRAGLIYWLNEMEKGATKADVLTGFSESNEFNKIMANYGIK